MQAAQVRGGEAPAPDAAAALDGAPRRRPDDAAGAPSRCDALSEREREVLARMAAGDSNKLIARAFDLSPHTVKRHVANILDKLGCSRAARPRPAGASRREAEPASPLVRLTGPDAPAASSWLLEQAAVPQADAIRHAALRLGNAETVAA